MLHKRSFHMPRAVCFQRVGWSVIPYPVDYRKKGEGADWSFWSTFSGGLRTLAFGLHEWLGLLAYWVSGRTSTLLPSPDEG